MRFWFLFVVFVLSLPTFTLAQTITLTAPLTSATVPEGDDYATNRLHNAWDFNERYDIGWEEKFVGSTVQANNGIWSATFESADAYVFPLYTPIIDSLYSEGISGDKSLPRFGINHPIEASKYTHLSYKLRQSQRSAFAIYWNNENSQTNWPIGRNFAARADYDYFNGDLKIRNDWHMYNFDMSNLAGNFEQSAGSWSNEIYALRLDGSLSGGAGALTELDWIRLVDPESAPQVTVSWSASDSPHPYNIVVYFDDDASGNDGIPFASLETNDSSGSYTFPSAMFPPGEYYFYVSVREVNYSRPISYSNYSAKLTINKAPEVSFASPTTVTAQEYSSSEVGDPWDMSNQEDIDNRVGSSWPDIWRQFLNSTFESGLFKAVADLPWNDATESDVQLHFNVPDNKPIDTSKYRYFTYRIWVDSTGFSDVSDRIKRGWVSRVVTWNDDFIPHGRSRHHFLYTGWNTYTIDLWDPYFTEIGTPFNEWHNLLNLRLDPLETDQYTWFFLDWVKLTAENYAENEQFDISFDLSDSDDSNFDVSLYYDTDQVGFDGTLITTLEDLSPGSHTYTWSTSNLPSGQRYFIYAVANDGINASKFYTDVPIIADSSGSGNLQTPLYLPWNSFLGMVNVLELINPNDAPTQARVSFFSINGTETHSQLVNIDGSGQRDLIVNDMPGFVPDSYGIVKVEFTDPIDGRVSYYRREQSSSNFEFAYSTPFLNPLRGKTSVGFNTFQPSVNGSEVSFSVYNWLTLINLASEEKSFTVRSYNQTGTLLQTRLLTIPGFGRMDVDGGHALVGPSVVGVHEITPSDDSAPYNAQLMRYGSNAPPGLPPTRYAFAFPLTAQAGTSDALHVPISNQFGGNAWVEVINTLSQSTQVTLDFYNAAGTLIVREQPTIKAHAQFHFNGSQYLTTGESGHVTITPALPDSIVAQSMFYFRNGAGSISAMYGSQGQADQLSTLSGSYNMFLGMENWLRLMNTGPEKTSVKVTTNTVNGNYSSVYDIPAYGTVDVPIHDEDVFGTAANTYGMVQAMTLDSASVVSELVRVRAEASGQLDFATSTAVRPR